MARFLCPVVRDAGITGSRRFLLREKQAHRHPSAMLREQRRGQHALIEDLALGLAWAVDKHLLSARVPPLADVLHEPASRLAKILHLLM